MKIDNYCPNCRKLRVKEHRKYVIRGGEERQLYKCENCGVASLSVRASSPLFCRTVPARYIHPFPIPPR